MGLYGNIMFESGIEHEVVTEAGIFKRIREKLSKKQKETKNKNVPSNNKSDQNDNTPYERKEVHSKSDFDKFYKNNDFILECLDGSEEDCQVLANILAKNYKINTPVKIYVTTGKDFNKVYDLAGGNAYQDSVHHVIIPLDTLKNTKDISLAKGTIHARYFNDVVDNNEYREYKAGRHKKSPEIQWLIDYYGE